MTSPTVTVAILSQAEPQAIFFQRERESETVKPIHLVGLLISGAFV